MQEKHEVIIKKLNRNKAENTDYSSRIKEFEEKQRKEGETLAKLIKVGKQAEGIHKGLSEEVIKHKRERAMKRDEIEKIDMALREFESETKNKTALNNMFSKIMEKRIDGVLGRLGDLGKVSKEYDEIITTACSRLDNIVVRNYEAARAVIDFLKTERLGRASCIILDKIGEYSNYMKKAFHPLKNAVRLFDLIEPKTE